MRSGRDYGWPNVSYGVQYDARQADGRRNVPVGYGRASMPGVEEPIYFWVPSIAPSGMTFYTGNLRIREVREGPNGALYLLGGNSLLRVTPAR